MPTARRRLQGMLGACGDGELVEELFSMTWMSV